MMTDINTLPGSDILTLGQIGERSTSAYDIQLAILTFLLLLFLVWVSIHDIKYHKIENFTHPVIMMVGFFIADITVIERIAGLLACFIPFLIVNIISKNGIGMGDVKLVGAFGFALGIYGGMYSAVAGLCLMLVTAGIRQALTKTKEAVPLAPYLCIAFSTVLFIQSF